MAQVDNKDIQMQADDLYREEVITDRRVGSIRRLTPITADGSDDTARPVLYVGQAQVMTPMGAIPLSFELHAQSLQEAVDQFAGAAEEAVERTAKELEEMRRDADVFVMGEDIGSFGGPLHSNMGLWDEFGGQNRVIDTPTGDLGGPAYRKYDLEAWMPGRGEKGDYGEVTSASNCTDYQARRLGVRTKIPDQKGNHFVHTLNGTAVAISRVMIALLENHQQADGSIVIPEVLHPWTGLEKIG